MTDFSEDFEDPGISDNTQLSTSNTAFTTLTAAATFTAQSEQYKGGSFSGYFNTSSQSKNAVYDSGNSDTTWYIRFYIRPVTSPGAATGMCNACQTTDTVPNAQIRMTTSGTLQLRDKYNDVGSAMTIGNTSEWTRVEWKVTPNASTGTQEMRVFFGTDLENDVNNYTATTSSQTCKNYGTSMGRVAFGVLSTDTMAYYIDDIAVSSTGWVGPSLTITEKSSSDSTQLGLSTESASAPLVIVSSTDSTQLGLSTESRSFATVTMDRSDSGIVSLSTESGMDEPLTGETSGEWYIDIKPRVGVW